MDPETPLVAARPFPVAARAALADRQLRDNLRRATGTIRDKRARVVDEVPDWEALAAPVPASRTTCWPGCRNC